MKRDDGDDGEEEEEGDSVIHPDDESDDDSEIQSYREKVDDPHHTDMDHHLQTKTSTYLGFFSCIK